MWRRARCALSAVCAHTQLRLLVALRVSCVVHAVSSTQGLRCCLSDLVPVKSVVRMLANWHDEAQGGECLLSLLVSLGISRAVAAGYVAALVDVGVDCMEDLRTVVASPELLVRFLLPARAAVRHCCGTGIGRSIRGAPDAADQGGRWRSHEKVTRKRRSFHREVIVGCTRTTLKILRNTNTHRNTNRNTRYTCDTGQTRNRLLAQWVHLTNHAADSGDRHSSPRRKYMKYKYKCKIYNWGQYR